jgi:hypothetical protein
MLAASAGWMERHFVGKLPILHRAKLELSHSIFSAGFGLARLKFANISMNFGRSTSLILHEETT